MAELTQAQLRSIERRLLTSRELLECTLADPHLDGRIWAVLVLHRRTPIHLGAWERRLRRACNRYALDPLRTFDLTVRRVRDFSAP